MLRKTLTLLFTFLLLSCSEKSALSSLELNGEKVPAFGKTAAACEASSDQNKGLSVFKFTDAQKEAFYSGEKFLSLLLRFRDEKNDSSFKAGFLYDEDFNKNGSVKKEISGRNIAEGSFSAAGAKEVTLSITPDSLPEGFFISTDGKIRIKKAGFTEQKKGWSRDYEGTPLFAFTKTGGNADFSFTECTKDGAEDLIIRIAEKTVLPKIEITLSESDRGTYKAQNRVFLKIGGETFSIRIPGKECVKVFHSDSLIGKTGDITVTKNVQAVKSIFFKKEDKTLYDYKDAPLVPVKTDLGLITDWNREKWRCLSYELFEWDMFPGILFFDFADYNIQNLFLTRLAFFAEKEGYKGTLVSDYIVRTKHGYNAHDYKAEDLAAFFSLAQKTGFKLSEEELLLRKILLHNRIIEENGSGLFSPVRGSIISISRESSDSLRWQFVAHESWHGIFFTDEGFRKEVKKLYDSFDESSMEFIKIYWQYAPGLGYDINDSYLMQNEFMAYIMQQGLSNVQKYFLNLCERNTVKEKCPELGEYIKENGAIDFYNAGYELNDYAFDRWGLSAGRVSLVSRTD